MTIPSLVLFYPKVLTGAAPAQTPAAASQNEPKETVEHFNSLCDAIKKILDKHPKIVAFGEVHPEEGFTYKSTKAYFAEEIVPLLAKEGIKDLIIEQILSDPKIEKELDIFYRTGCDISEEKTPILWINIGYSDKDALIKVLYKCRELKIRVHPGGMTIPQAKTTVLKGNYSQNTELKRMAMKYNGLSTRSAINHLRKTIPGVRLAVYGGIMHNDIGADSTRIKDGTNWGDQLAKKHNKSYFEVDLLLPVNANEMRTFIRPSRWEEKLEPYVTTSISINNSYSIFIDQ